MCVHRYGLALCHRCVFSQVRGEKVETCQLIQRCKVKRRSSVVSLLQRFERAFVVCRGFICGSSPTVSPVSKVVLKR